MRWCGTMLPHHRITYNWFGCTRTSIPIEPRARQVAVTVSLMPDTVDTVLWAADDGWIYHPKHVEQLTDMNKL